MVELDLPEVQEPLEQWDLSVRMRFEFFLQLLFLILFQMASFIAVARLTG